MKKNKSSLLKRLRTAARVLLKIATVFTFISGAAYAQGTAGLIGVSPGFPQVDGVGAQQTCSYDSGTSTLTLTALTNSYFADPNSFENINNGIVTITAVLDVNGDPTSGTLTIAGTTNSGLTDPLLTATITQIGLEDTNGSAALGTDRVDVRATPNGGSIFTGPNWPAGAPDVAASVFMTNSDYAGSVAADWSCITANMTIGAEFFPVAIDVGNYLGQQQLTAAVSIGNDGLTLGTVTQQFDPTAPIDTVINQSPLACSACALAGDPVDLTVSAGPAPIDVENYIGQQQATAEANIVSDNLTVGTITPQFDPTAPIGTVINQSPLACTGCVMAGEPVDLTVSAGPAPIDVENYIGQQQATAEANIVSDNLTVGTVTMPFDAAPIGTVINQSPLACTGCVMAGEPVDLTVSAGPAPIDVPDYLGQQQATAEANIVTDNLTVGTITQQFDPTAPIGQVIGQFPLACTGCVMAGEPVDLTVSAGPAPIDVENYIGQQQATAEANIVTDNLTVGTVTQQFDPTAPIGQVIGQFPLACTGCVMAGEPVDLTVSAGPAPIDVSDYVGQQEATATFNIGNDGLTVGTITQQFDLTAPIGQVIGQFPLACTGCVMAGEPVDLTVSAGPAPIDVENYIGQQQATAEANIVTDNLTVGTITQQFDPTAPIGQVIGQFPLACTGCVMAGEPVDLTVSAGPAPIDVENYIGQQQATAEANIVTDNLTVGTVTQQFDPTAPIGQVIGQFPLACTGCVMAGEPVDLTVSAGPAPIDVSDYVGQQEATATFNIGNDGLTVGTITQQFDLTAPIGQVIGQFPLACTGCVMAGEPVDLTVSAGPAPIDVPDYLGQQQATAEANIVTDNLTVGTVTQQFDPTAPIGQVIGQFPLACTGCVMAGEPVDLTVSAGPAPIDVSDYVGQQQATAEANIVTDNLTVGTVTQQFDPTAPIGQVIGQFPLACTGCVMAGEPVDLTVSAGPAPIDVENYIGQQQVTAAINIVSDNLTVGTVTRVANQAPIGEVIAQFPLACVACAMAADPVDLTISTGPAPVDVGEYVGQQQATAEANIVSDNLTVGTVTFQNDLAEPGTVIRQFPTTCVACTTALDPVDLTISSGPALISIDAQPYGSLRIDGNGVVPVVIFGTADFPVDAINRQTLNFQGLEVAFVSGTAELNCVKQAFDNDAFDDLLCEFIDDAKWRELGADNIATLTGELNDGSPFSGSDEVSLVEPKKSKALSPLLLGLILPLALLRRRLRRA